MLSASRRTILTTLSAMLVSTSAAAQSISDAVANLEFRNIGPATMSGRIVDIAVTEVNPFTFYLASATGGVWKTTNNGVTFSPVFERQATHSVGDIAVHQLDTNIVWVGTGERANRQSSSWGDGIYKSMDGGQTWEHKGLRDSHHIGRVALHPTDPRIVYVAAMGHLWGPNEERGLYMSTDGGDTWTRTLEGDENTGVVDVAVDPSDPNVVYAATYQRRRRPFGFHGGGPGSGLFKSTDGGRTWRALTTGLPEGEIGRIGISIYRTDPNIVYVSVEQGWRYNASTAYNERRAGVYRSEDKGETWEFMSDWNPRPMYASQPLVDPNDDQRIYMLNSFSWSDDGGRTFRRASQSLHGDDRLVWVDPNDSRHVMKADDGGLGISYDRAQTWLYVTSLPLSQYYRVSVDMRDPYWVYGGLQDNGSWMGPNATFRREGILNEDWIKTGGGDGFLNLIDTTDNRTLYTESQYLGLSRLDVVTGARQSIRPDNPRGAIAARRNWDAWGPGSPEPELGNAMAPANWDGPFLISHHANTVIYAGTNQLWRSENRGDTWETLGDLTTGVNRRELEIMGERAHDTTLSLDDGIPYYPTLTAIGESRFDAQVLYVGTDDGNLQTSHDRGRTWTNVTDRLAGLPPSAWISGIETSHHTSGVVYVVAHNYRNNDFANYAYRSNDDGTTWQSITGDLPAARVLRTLREDLENPNVLYVGAELGLFYSYDGGIRWTALTGNLPTVAVNDLVIHPRDNDLVLGTHGRGIWIYDNLNALQELNDNVIASRAHLFSVAPARMIRYRGERGHTGDMIFEGQNPAAGATIDYYLREAVDSTRISVSVLTSHGDQVAEVRPATKAGVNRVVWNLRYSRAGTNARGPWVLPGEYTIRLTVDGHEFEQIVQVSDDLRVDVSLRERIAWHQRVRRIEQLVVRHATSSDSLTAIERQFEEMDEDQRRTFSELEQRVDSIAPLARELRNRMFRLYGQISDWPQPMTADQRSQISYFTGWIERLGPEIDAILRAAAEIPE